MAFDFKEIELKWQKYWADQQIFKASRDEKRKKIYCLEMFPYPSGAGLHVGHLKNYVPMDAFCRFKSMQGYNVLHPMGWDAFGQPAENEAIRRGRNPREMVPEYTAVYKQTLIRAGCSYDWDREINTSLPDYYKWTQWIFLLLYKKGLAYRATAPINWCPTCKTGLANEEVKEGRCWRCDSAVEKKPMPQWFFRITAYADRLLRDLDHLNWSDGMKEMQRDWIGRSDGAEIEFRVVDHDLAIPVFTTRPDTLFGATFMVLAPEHPLLLRITRPEKKAEVKAYIRHAQSETDMERQVAERSKTGVFTGAHAVNPVTGQKIPIWTADYVLMGYGTGAIMCVPGQDSRDWEFAEKFGLPIVRTVQPPTDFNGKAYLGDGPAINSDFLNGLHIVAAKERMIAWLEQKKIGKPEVNYRLRDWLVSRQRYWGAPIPIVHCPRCGEVPVPEEQLPVLLPEVEHYQPSGTGESPLATIAAFVNTVCPACGATGAKRETDTMGGYACSAWYFLRFADPKNNRVFASREALDYWLPVDLYAGGIEHARSHLLYSRFWTKVFYDQGLLGFDEPFLTLRNQGSLLAMTPGRRPRSVEKADGLGSVDNIVDWIVLKPEERDSFPPDQVVWRWARMSKSKGNVVTPDEIAARYGIDALRVYEMFVAPYEDDVHWTEEGIQGSFRFISRVWRWLQAALALYSRQWRENLPKQETPDERRLRRKLHQTIRKVGADIEGFQFNTAIAAIMELLNEIYGYAPPDKEQLPGNVNPAIVSELAENLTLLLAPFAPHLGEEIWHRLGHAETVYRTGWPEFDAGIAVEGEINIMVQINGKIRDKVVVHRDAPEAEVRGLVLASPRVQQFVHGKKVSKTVFVANQMFSIVVE